MKKKYSKAFIKIIYSERDILLGSNGNPFDDGDIYIGEMIIDEF